MYLKRRGDALSKFGNAHVLHDDSVGPGLGNRRQRLLSFEEFVVENQRIERDEPLHPTSVQRLHHLREFRQPKANLGPGSKMSEPKVYCVSPSFDSRLELRPITRRAHQFGFFPDAFHGALSTI